MLNNEEEKRRAFSQVYFLLRIEKKGKTQENLNKQNV